MRERERGVGYMTLLPGNHDNSSSTNKIAGAPSPCPQNGYIQEVEKLKQILEIPSEKENLISRYNPLNNFKVDCCLDLDEVFNKKNDINPEIAKAIALQTINRKYPQKDWLYIYTDGSLMDQNEGAGAGATCQYVSLYKNVAKYTTNFDGEVEAIYTSLQNVFVWLNQVIPEKKRPTEGCTGKNGEWEKSLGQKKISNILDDIKIYGSYEETKRKAENRKDWRMLGLQLIEVGEEFCGSKSEDLQNSIKKQSSNYFRNYHRDSLEELRIFLENESWELCPVKPDFSILQLQVCDAVAANISAQEFRSLRHVLKSWKPRSDGGQTTVSSPDCSSSNHSQDGSSITGGYFARYSESGSPFDIGLDDVHEEDILANIGNCIAYCGFKNSKLKMPNTICNQNEALSDLLHVGNYEEVLCIVPWSPISPNLTPLDFYLWGHLKAVVYATPMNDAEELLQRVENACHLIRDDNMVLSELASCVYVVRRSTLTRFPNILMAHSVYNVNVMFYLTTLTTAEIVSASPDEPSGYFSDESDEDIPEELKKDFVDENAGDTVTNKHSKPSSKRTSRREFMKAPILTNTTLTVLRQCGKYLQMSRLLRPIACEVIICMTQLFDYYLYAVHTFFTADLPVSSHSLYNLKLEASLKRIQDNLIVPDPSQLAESDSDHIENTRDKNLLHQVPQPHISSVVDLGQQESLHGLAERVVAVESLVFLAKQLEFLQSYLEHLQGGSSYLQQFFSQTVAATSELRRPVYMCVSACAVDFRVTLVLMSKVNWEVKEVMSQHSQYVDILLRIHMSIAPTHIVSLYPNKGKLNDYITGAAGVQYATGRSCHAHSNSKGGVHYTLGKYRPPH
ncbi:hypothetical protein ANN_19285 [Periplaneta americana]|uniref:Syndetin C-terminal domain-containing protein n=1 Tax=Periplaneta americana TaxID=6978 RepID=A0ABQ8S9G2_PERAM|nr:hypothetical protein ANN_19285 [Periplaneta americana]